MATTLQTAPARTPKTALVWSRLLASAVAVRDRSGEDRGAVTAEIAAFIIIGLIFVAAIATITGEVATTLGTRITDLIGGF